MGGAEEEEEEEKYMCKESEWEGGKEVKWRNELGVCVRTKGREKEEDVPKFLIKLPFGWV